VGIGLKVYQETRSKKLVDMFANIHLSIPYRKVIEIKQALVENVKEATRDKGGIYVPSSISPDKPLFFAIDNIDLTIDIPDGVTMDLPTYKKQTHSRSGTIAGHWQEYLKKKRKDQHGQH